MTENFWQGRKVFLTGHTGFKGSWLAFILRSFGAEVTGYALRPISSPNLFDLINLDMNSIIGNVRSALHGDFAAASRHN